MGRGLHPSSATLVSAVPVSPVYIDVYFKQSRDFIQCGGGRGEQSFSKGNSRRTNTVEESLLRTKRTM